MNTYAWSVAIYECEIWNINDKEEKGLDTFEMYSRKRMERISWNI